MVREHSAGQGTYHVTRPFQLALALPCPAPPAPPCPAIRRALPGGDQPGRSGATIWRGTGLGLPTSGRNVRLPQERRGETRDVGPNYATPRPPHPAGGSVPAAASQSV